MDGLVEQKSFKVSAKASYKTCAFWKYSYKIDDFRIFFPGGGATAEARR
jgi:hypothetical protein